MQKRNQLFIISRAVRESLSIDEVNASIEGLKELCLYALPYPTVDIWVASDGIAYTTLNDPAKLEDDRIKEWLDNDLMKKLEPDDNGHERVTTNFGPGSWIEFNNISLEGNVPCYRYLHIDNNKNFPKQRLLLDPEPVDEAERICIANGLIVLLATRNTVKEVEHRKCVSLGIGAKKSGRKSYEYVTTLHLPPIAEMPEADGPGKPNGGIKTPHLRRGHIRRQHFGPANELIKRIWIQPVFVNADKDWVSTRRAYNIGSAPNNQGARPTRESTPQ